MTMITKTDWTQTNSNMKLNIKEEMFENLTVGQNSLWLQVDLNGTKRWTEETEQRFSCPEVRTISMISTDLKEKKPLINRSAILVYFMISCKI